MKAIEIEDLNIKYNNISVLKDINLTIEDKEFVAIIGPNGGGKTTLLKAILGLVKPSTGKIKIYGSKPEDKNRSLGYVSQFTKFERTFPIDVFDVVLMGRLKSSIKVFNKYSKADIEYTKNVMNKLDIYKLKDRQIGQLSGGQLQRVLIARALCMEPKLLLLDEPTASLDEKSKSNIYSILKDLNKNMTILIVTHDVGFVFSYIDKVACLNQKLFYHGEPELNKDIMDKVYGCPVDVIAHGDIPHRVFRNHEGEL